MPILRVNGDKISVEEGSIGLKKALSSVADGSVIFIAPSNRAFSSPYGTVALAVFDSPNRGPTFSYSETCFGDSLRAVGIDNIVIEGTRKELSYIDLERMEVVSSVGQNGESSVLSIGRSAENGVVFSCVLLNDEEAFPGDLGYVLAERNIGGIVFTPYNGKKKKEKKGKNEMDFALETGSLPVSGWKRRMDPRARFLRDLRYEEAAFLGSNIGNYNESRIKELSSLILSEGLDIASMGTIFASRPNDSPEAIIERIASGWWVRDLSECEGVVATGGFNTIPYDLRGSFPDAIVAAFAIPSVLTASHAVSEKPFGVRSAAVLAFYETVYGYAVLSEGYSPKSLLDAWWGRFPGCFYHNRFLLLIISKSIRFMGKRSGDLVSEGNSILNLVCKKRYRLPKEFTMNPESSYGGNSTVPETDLILEFNRIRLKNSNS